MTTKTTKSLAATPKRAVKKAKLAGIDLPDTPTVSADELQTQIRRRAYELFLQRGPAAGNAEADWLQAEYEVTVALSTTNAVSAAAPAKVKAPRAVRPRSIPRSSGSATATTTRTRRKQPPATSKG